MIHYLHLDGEEKPITFVYSVPWEYELEHPGKFYNTEVTELCVQILRAGAALTQAISDVPDENTGTVDKLISMVSRANAAGGFSMVKFVDILYICLRVGHRKTGKPADFTPRDVADWIGGNNEAVGKFTTLLLQANFNLPGEESQSPGDSKSPGDSDGAKKKKPAR